MVGLEELFVVISLIVYSQILGDGTAFCTTTVKIGER
jgi:hypothetical protein